jgi:hypothetical protein
MVVATITKNGAIAAKRQTELCVLSNQHASWFGVTATIGPSTKFEAVASPSTQSSRLQSAKSVMRIPLFLARIS